MPTTMYDEWVYFVQSTWDGLQNEPIKIGWANNTDSRIARHQTANPYPLKILLKLRGGPIEERVLHVLFRAAHLRGEWFLPTVELLDFIANPPSDLAAHLGTARVPQQGMSLGLMTKAELKKRGWPI